MFHGHLDCFQKLPPGGRPNTKPGDNGTPNAHNRWFILFYHVWGPTYLKIHKIAYGWGTGHMWLHTTLEDLWPQYMILEMCWDGLWTLSFGLSQYHGHGSWLMCKVAWGPLTRDIQIMWLVKKTVTIQIHCRPKREGMKDHQNSNGLNGHVDFTPTLHSHTLLVPHA
jgi:hypothetical protein